MAELLEIVIGLGCQRDTAPATLEAAIATATRPLGAVRVRRLASHVRKRDEPALHYLRAAHAWTLILYPSARLARIDVPNPSARVMQEMGTSSVAEAAALLAAAGGELLVPRLKHVGADGKGVTIAIARWSGKVSLPSPWRATDAPRPAQGTA